MFLLDRGLSHVDSLLDDGHLRQHLFLFVLQVVHSALYFAFVVGELSQISVCFLDLPNINCGLVHQGTLGHVASMSLALIDEIQQTVPLSAFAKYRDRLYGAVKV